MKTLPNNPVSGLHPMTGSQDIPAHPSQKGLTPSGKKDWVEVAFDYGRYTQAFGQGELLIVLSLSICWLAIIQVLNLKLGESVLESSHFGLSASIAIITLLAHHIFYKLEHDQSNSYLGRVLSDLLLIVLMAILHWVYFGLQDGSLSLSSLDLSQVFWFFLVIVGMVFLFEVVVSGLKYLLGLLRLSIL